MRTEKITLSQALRKYGEPKLRLLTAATNSHFTFLLNRARSYPLSARHTRCVIMKQGRGDKEVLIGWAVFDGNKSRLNRKDRYASMGVYVKPAYRRKGYGKKLLDILLESEESRHPTRLPLILADSNKLVRTALTSRGRSFKWNDVPTCEETSNWYFFAYRAK